MSNKYDYNSLSHTKWECKYHIVFAPKHRRRVIYGKIKRDIGIILRKLCEQNRERQRRFRDKTKEDDNVTVTLGNAIEENKKENNKIDNKKSRYCNYEQREYTPEFLESFYVNK